MRIGLFTDSYRPSINGITFVVESLKIQLEALGHEVYVFCPARSIRPSKQIELLAEDDHIIRFPSFPSGFFNEFDISVFFPPLVLRQIEDMQLDIVHIFTPSQVGLLGINAALRSNTPLVIQYCTDLYEYIDNYPNVLPGVLALIGVVYPAHIKLSGREIRDIINIYRPQRDTAQWAQKTVAKAITLLHSKADAVIALSRKSHQQLQSWQDENYQYPLVLMPNGVNALPTPSAAEITAFHKKWGLDKKDEIIGFVGRLGEEKNLALLIKAFDRIGKERPRAKLLFVGDFNYRAQLEALAAASRFPDRILFTGTMPRETLGVVYASLSVFTFPSLKDTQGWVLHEAAQAGVPIVLIDQDVSEVVHDGENGYFAKNNATDFARKVVSILKDPKKQATFGANSRRLAMRFTEKKQVQKLERLYEQLIESHPNRMTTPYFTKTVHRLRIYLKRLVS